VQQLCLPFGFTVGRSFDDFWVHDKNAQLVHQLQQVAMTGAKNSLVFWGEGASGKTHLLEAVCKTTHEQGLRAGYIDFSTIDQLSTNVLDDLEQLDLLCLDNIHMLDHSQYYYFQVAAFRLYNEFRAQNKSLIVSSSKPINALKQVLPDLTSRLQWELQYQLLSFSQLDTQGFLIWSAQRRGMVLSKIVADYIVNRHARDCPALVNLLNQLEHISLMEQRKLTLPFVKKVMTLRL